MEVRKGYKQTEVGVIPEDWDVKSLQDGIKLLSGHHVLAQYCNTDGIGFPYITGPADFPNGVIQHSKFTEKPSTICRANDILVTVKGSGAGTIVLSDAEYCISRQLMAVRVGDWDTKFIYFLLVHDSLLFGAAATGLIPGLSRSDILGKQIAVPPLPEQRAIAAALSDVDSLLSALDALIAKKRLIKQGAMQELLTGKRRLPGFGGEWEVKELRSLADIQRGASPRPIDSPVWYDKTSRVGWVRISDVTDSDGIFLNRTRDYLSEQGIANSRYLPSGTLIMSICATVGIPIITNIDACIHDGFVGFTKLRQVEQMFLLYKLKELEPSFRLMGQTGSQNNLNSDLVRNCPVLLPPIAEQTAIAEILSDMDTEIAALEARREKTRLLKQCMMQELLTGKTRLL